MRTKLEKQQNLDLELDILKEAQTQIEQETA
jgi:hypothetical protein